MTEKQRALRVLLLLAENMKACSNKKHNSVRDEDWEYWLHREKRHFNHLAEMKLLFKFDKYEDIN